MPRSFSHRVYFSAVLPIALLVTMALSARAEAKHDGTPLVAPVRILVKVREPLALDLESTLTSAAGDIGRDRLSTGRSKRFFADHSAQKMRPLYPRLLQIRQRHGWSDAQVAEDIRRTFPKRARRLHLPPSTPAISRTYVLEVATGTAQSLGSILQRLKADPNVEFAEPDQVVSVNALPNDPFLSTSGSWGQPFADLWGLYAINAPTAWNTTQGDGVVVAVVDTGLDYRHPDIAANVWVNSREVAGNGIDDDANGYVDDIHGWDFVGDDYQNPRSSNDPIDHNGHGTHVAGIIAAVGNNGIGVIGVASHAKIMAVKGLDATGQGLDSALASAVLYAARNGADVINASWGGQGQSQAIEDAIQFAYSVGAVFVAAAGNSGMDAWGFYPANSPEAITVSAVNDTNGYPAFTNYGSKIDVAAPGVGILSLRAAGTTLGNVVNNNYVVLDGTSMAAPHVSGAAALLMSKTPDFPIEDLRQTLRASATGGSWNALAGGGIVNAQAALSFAGALQARITSPTGRIEATAPVTISGIAQGAGFDHYILEYGRGLQPNSWYPIATGTSPTPMGTLGVFDPSVVPDGPVMIRLTVFDRMGRSFSDHLELYVSYISITSPANPPAPVSALELKTGTKIQIQRHGNRAVLREDPHRMGEGSISDNGLERVWCDPGRWWSKPGDQWAHRHLGHLGDHRGGLLHNPRPGRQHQIHQPGGHSRLHRAGSRVPAVAPGSRLGRQLRQLQRVDDPGGRRGG